MQHYFFFQQWCWFQWPFLGLYHFFPTIFCFFKFNNYSKQPAKFFFFLKEPAIFFLERTCQISIYSNLLRTEVPDSGERAESRWRYRDTENEEREGNWSTRQWREIFQRGKKDGINFFFFLRIVLQYNSKIRIVL